MFDWDDPRLGDMSKDAQNSPAEIIRNIDNDLNVKIWDYYQVRYPGWEVIVSNPTKVLLTKGEVTIKFHLVSLQICIETLDGGFHHFGAIPTIQGFEDVLCRPNGIEL